MICNRIGFPQTTLFHSITYTSQTLERRESSQHFLLGTRDLKPEKKNLAFFAYMLIGIMIQKAQSCK